MKKCSTCREDKPVSEFHRDRSRKDGLTPQCKPCKRESVRRSDAKHADRKREYNRQYARRYYQQNREQRREYHREYREQNREYYREYSRLRWHDNPEKRRINDQRRRARKRDATVEHFTAADLTERWGIEPRCTYCGEVPEELHWDHVVPLSQGGSHTLDNLAPACNSCNLSKHASGLSEWAERRFLLREALADAIGIGVDQLPDELEVEVEVNVPQ